MTTVGFRVEGGGNIGMGHIMRCLSLAREFIRQGCDVFFISCMSEARSVIENCGIKLVEGQKLIYLSNSDVSTLPTSELEKEASIVRNIMYEYDTDILILDSYNVNAVYMKLLKEQIRHLVYIDDINRFINPADILINGNSTGNFMNYSKLQGQKLLLGTDFNLIREEFKNLPPKTIGTQIKNIMLTSGGSDPYNCSQNILNMVIDYTVGEGIYVHVVVGKSFPFEKNLDAFSEKYKNVILHKNVKEMSEIMKLCDLAVSAGGSTLYELCACGVPTLSFILADNQEFLVQKMEELEYVKSLGWYDKIDRNELLQYLAFLNKEVEYRKTLSRKIQSLVDGNGTERVVKNILENIDLRRM